MVVTFTEAATKELKERLRENLSLALEALLQGSSKDETVLSIVQLYQDLYSQSLLEAAILNFDQSAIFTIHGFCQRMLQENAFESSALFDAELISSEKDIVEEIVNDFWRKEVYQLSADDLRLLTLNRESLLNLCKQVMSSPNHIFEPKLSEEELQVKQEQFAKIKADCEQIRMVFDRSESDIYSKLFEKGSLSGAKYRASSWEKKKAEFLSFLKKPQANVSIINYFGQKVAESAKKGKDAPEHEVFRLCSNLEERENPRLLDIL